MSTSAEKAKQQAPSLLEDEQWNSHEHFPLLQTDLL